MPTKARYNSARDRLQNSASNTLMDLQEFARKLRSNQVARLEYGVITIDGENEEITIDDAIGGNEIINISKDGFIVKNTSGTEITRMNSTGFNLKNGSGTTIINMDLSGMSINDNSGNERMRFQDGAFDIKDTNNDTVIRFNDDGATYYGQASGQSFLNFVRDGFRFGNINYNYFTNSFNQKETRVLLTAYNSSEADRDTQSGILNYDRNENQSTFLFCGETYENNSFDAFYLRYGIIGVRNVWSIEMLSSDGENAIMQVPKHQGSLSSYPGFGHVYYDNSISRLVVTSQNLYKPLAYEEDLPPSGYTGGISVETKYGEGIMDFNNGSFQGITYP
jgi:hypothetical protein